MGRIEEAVDDSHVEEHVLVLLSGGNGDLLQLYDGRDLGAGVLVLAGRRGLLLLLRWTVFRRVGHGVRRGGVGGCSRARGLRLLAALLLPVAAVRGGRGPLGPTRAGAAAARAPSPGTRRRIRREKKER